MQHCISPRKNSSQIIVFAAASAAEMPPVEPICETESSHQAAHLVDSEPGQTQAVNLGDHLKRVSGWTNDLLIFFVSISRGDTLFTVLVSVELALFQTFQEEVFH